MLQRVYCNNGRIAVVHGVGGGAAPAAERPAGGARERRAVLGAGRLRGARRVLPRVRALPRLQQPRAAYGHH